MTEWLRPVFGRARTPMPSTAGTDRPISFSFDDSTESEDSNIARPRPASRVSSYIGLRPSTPPVHDPDTFPNFRKPDNVYHEPSGAQMAEMLKVAVMSQSTFDPLPIEYNSCILHVLEAYQGMMVEISKKEEEIEAIKHQHTEAIRDFEDMATRWDSKEKDYQAEIKNLEVLLSKTEGGMEKVTLARSKSTVHGSKKIKEVVKELKPIKQRDSEQDSNATMASHGCRPLYIQQEGNPTSWYKKKNKKNTRAFAKEQPYNADFVDSQHDAPPRTRNLKLQHSRASPQYTLDNSAEARPSQRSPHLTQEQLKALERERSLKEIGVVFDSESDSSDSSEEPAGLELQILRAKYGTGTDPQKPLPQAPGESPLGKLRRVASDQADRPKSEMKGPTNFPNQMGFSFKPGDDLSILGQWQKRGTKSGGYTLEQSSSSEQNFQARVGREEIERHKATPPKSKPEPAKSPEAAYGDGGSLLRYDSTSSVLTAFRAGSGRNSSSGSQRNSFSGHRMPGAGNSDAITAAVRAARNSRAWSDEQRNSSESATEGGNPSRINSNVGGYMHSNGRASEGSTGNWTKQSRAEPSRDE